MLYIDSISIYITALLIFLTILVVLASRFFFDLAIFVRLEYFSLMLFALCGMILMSMGAELITLFISLEISSLALYVLTGFEKTRAKSNEAILKYFIINSFIGTFFIMGCAFVYGAIGSTYISEISSYLATHSIYDNQLLLVGLIFILAVTLFKITAFPFHSWSLDVYSGANIPITSFLVSASKVAGFMFFIRIILEGFIGAREFWQEILFFVTVFTLFAGNFLSIKQQKVKDMLIASSIVHTGYILIYISMIDSFSIESISAILFYLLAYSVAISGTLMILSYIINTTDIEGYFSDFKGLAHKRAFSAFTLSILMLSFVGYPLTVGFLGKFYLFSSSMQNGGTVLVVIGVINTILSLYYYLKPIVYMYFYKDTSLFDFKATTLMKFSVFIVISSIILGGLGIGLNIDNLIYILKF
jgi:NADH-quinone oxidoreductase subunit N